jgi:hypothetical protein
MKDTNLSPTARATIERVCAQFGRDTMRQLAIDYSLALGELERRQLRREIAAALKR